MSTVDDGVTEGPETFTANLFNPTNGLTLGEADTIATINIQEILGKQNMPRFFWCVIIVTETILHHYKVYNYSITIAILIL